MHPSYKNTHLSPERLNHHAANGRYNQLARVLHRKLQTAAGNRGPRHEADLI